jgi:hypothetical protein
MFFSISRPHTLLQGLRFIDKFGDKGEIWKKGLSIDKKFLVEEFGNNCSVSKNY